MSDDALILSSPPAPTHPRESRALPIPGSVSFMYDSLGPTSNTNNSITWTVDQIAPYPLTREEASHFQRRALASVNPAHVQQATRSHACITGTRNATRIDRIGKRLSERRKSRWTVLDRGCMAQTGCLPGGPFSREAHDRSIHRKDQSTSESCPTCIAPQPGAHL